MRVHGMAGTCSVALMITGLLLSAVVSGSALGAPGASGPLTKLTIFVGPTPIWDSVWMADQQGYFKAEGIDPVLKTFSAGTIALQTFKTGLGDIVLNGDLPAIRYWSDSHHDYRIITVIERDTKSMGVMARNTVKSASDLRGKVVATRVGTTGSYFIYEYLTRNGIPLNAVTIKNLDPPTLVTALCQNDISAFFIWSPFTQRASQVCPGQVHQLADGEGYVVQYDFAAVRPAWLSGHMALAEAFLRAVRRGASYAKTHFDAVARYAKDKYGLSPDVVHFQWSIQERPMTVDAAFYRDMKKEADWAFEAKQVKERLDFSTFVDLRPLKAIGETPTPVPVR